MSPHRATEEKEIQDISMTSIGKKTNQTDYYHTILPPEVTGGVRAIASTPQPSGDPACHPAQSSPIRSYFGRKHHPAHIPKSSDKDEDISCTARLQGIRSRKDA